MPAIVAPETAGFDVALTVKLVPTVAPLLGELTVTRSFDVVEVWVELATVVELELWPDVAATVMVYVDEKPVAPEVSHALAAKTCVPGVAVTGTEKVLLLMIGPYCTPSSHKIIPAIVAPETEGRELAVTVKLVPTVAPLAGELTVTKSCAIRVELA